jgi:vacuolar protein sorting-associated protein 13A/C
MTNTRICLTIDYVQLFNRILAPYVENLDLNQLNLGIMAGMFNILQLKDHFQLSLAGKLELENLRLKKEALDKFRLPVDVVQGL